MRRIPTQQPWTIPGEDKQYAYINYGKEGRSIFVIELNENGNTVNIQYDGVSCKQPTVKGFIFKEFESKNKYFNPTFWYKKTSWGERYPACIYFKEDNEIDKLDCDWDILDKMPVGPERTHYVETCSKAFWDRAKELANQQARPVNNILKNILGDVRRKTGIEFELDFYDTDYGYNWAEAYIPLEYKGKHYLLTWSNCD